MKLGSRYPLGEWATELGITPPEPVTAAAGGAKSAGVIAPSVTQQHSMAYQLQSMGFTVGSCCAVKGDEPTDSKSTESKRKESKVPPKVWEITAIDETNVVLMDPNRAVNNKDDTQTVSTTDAVVKKTLLKRHAFNWQREVTPIGVHSPMWAADLAVDVARRAVRATHDEFVCNTDQVQVFAVPCAVRAKCEFKKGCLTLVASSNMFITRSADDEAKTIIGIPLGAILKHDVFLSKHVKTANEEVGSDTGKLSKEVWHAPYWSVPENESAHNMKHATHSAEVPTSTGNITVHVPIMVNSKVIKAGDYLSVVPQKRKREA